MLCWRRITVVMIGALPEVGPVVQCDQCRAGEYPGQAWPDRFDRSTVLLLGLMPFEFFCDLEDYGDLDLN